MFSTWAVAKPNYYVPCLPGLALLIGMTWIRLSRSAWDTSNTMGRLARGLLRAQWLILLLTGILVPVVGSRFLIAAPWPWLALIAGVMATGVALGLWVWGQGADVVALLPLTVSIAISAQVVYGVLAPVDNASRGHRQFADRLESLITGRSNALSYFHEVDEGLWFYLRSVRLSPVPGSQPRYSESYDRIGGLIEGSLAAGWLPDPSIRLLEPQKLRLLEWLRLNGRNEPFLLLRATLYDQIAQDLKSLVTPVFREGELKRNSLILLQVNSRHDELAGSADGDPTRTLR
jgi:hypothetical protein